MSNMENIDASSSFCIQLLQLKPSHHVCGGFCVGEWGIPGICMFCVVVQPGSRMRNGTCRYALG